MPAARTPDILARLRARFERRRPIRAGSLIVTLYGDAIMPRGGALWLGSINDLVAPLGIESGLVRTAMSRLVTGGLFQRSRAGKSSYYRLSPEGEAEFTAAGERIYRAGDGGWDGQLQLIVLLETDARRRNERREALAGQGFGQLSPNVMLRPMGAQHAAAGDGDVALSARIEAEGAVARRLAGACWQLDELRNAYQGLLDDLGVDEGQAARAVQRMPDEAAFQLRLLLVHEWRLIVLRDPLLPAALLPQDWPGARARRVCGSLYRAVFQGGERWLDAHAVNEQGALPPADAAARGRFERR